MKQSKSGSKTSKKTTPKVSPAIPESTPSASMQNSIPWIEKYRPTCIEDIILDKQIERQIRIFLNDMENIHLIISGTPGIGKTTSVRCIAKKMLGSNLPEGYLELNSAEDRGIKSTSLIIPPFCKRVVNFRTSKIILLDEADSMTPKCQCDINNMIKLYGKKTKFIFTCNNSNGIIEDIQSVCRIIRFKKLTEDQIKKFLSKICTIEQIPFTDAGLSTICYISDGDMRKSVNNLQLTSYSYGLVDKHTVLNVCKIPDLEDIELIIQACEKCQLEKADEMMSNIIRQGYYYLDIISGFIRVLSNDKMETELKLGLIEIINRTKIAVSTGLRSKLQLTAMLARIIRLIFNNK